MFSKCLSIHNVLFFANADTHLPTIKNTIKQRIRFFWIGVSGFLRYNPSSGIAAERKKELIPFATACMELESIMLSEISQTVRDKYHMISPLTRM